MNLPTNHVILLMILLTTAACRGNQTPMSTSPTAGQVTVVLSPTHTAAPSITPTILPSAAFTPFNPTVTLIPKPTLDAICIVLPGGTGTASPDGKWIAVPCFGIDRSSRWADAFAYVRVQRLDKTQAWEVFTKDLYSSPNWRKPAGSGGLDLGYLDIVQWDKNSRYVFLAKQSTNDRFTYHYLDGFALYRLDTQTGHVSTWLRETGISYSFSFSPDERYLAHSTNLDGNLLHINNIETGKINTFVIPGRVWSIANFLWSPDSQKMVFISLYEDWLIIHEDWSIDQKSDISMLLYDLPSNKITTLISHDTRLLSPIEWISDSMLVLQDFWSGQSIIFDISSTVGINTPTP